MKFGYFDDENKEYVITTPETPLPWINYLGSDTFFSMISNTGCGYCFYKDARLRRIIRFRYNNPVGDGGGRFFYIKEKGGEAWSPCYLPCKTPLDSFKCRHGLGYTVFEASKSGLSATLTFTVPRKDNCELHLVTLKNDSDSRKSLNFWGCVEWCLFNAADDGENFQRNLSMAESEIEPSVIYHKTEYRERRNHYAFYALNVPAAGFDADRVSFTGRFGGWEAPECVAHETSSNSLEVGWYPIAAHRVELDLESGEEKSFVFVLGYAESPKDHKFIGDATDGIMNKQGARELISKYNSEETVREALVALAAYWESLLGIFYLESDNEKLNRMANIWNQYQCMVTFNMSRSTSYFESGMGRGMGFRDSCQDVLGFVHMIPERARERIIDLASIQKEDGSTCHQYQPLTKKGSPMFGTGFNDDPLWLVAAVTAYIKETGDFDILKHPTPFDSSPGTEVPLLDHIRRSVDYTITHLGPHRLPLIGLADWNDCMNLNSFSEDPDESFQNLAPLGGDPNTAESVFIAGMFVLYGREYAALCEALGDHAEASRISEAADEMEKAVMKDGWDGRWYLRAYDTFSEKIGSSKCKEGKIFIEPQGFCSLARIGKSEDMPMTALKSSREILCSSIGYELLNPPYSEFHAELGAITSFPPGYKENGSVFCQTNAWVAAAAAVNGDPEMAFDAYKRICPAYLEEISEIHKTEPYVYCQMIAGSYAVHPGEAKNSWLTATSAWSFVVLSQYILGIRPDYDGLRICPCLPDEIKEYRVKRLWRGATYDIHVVNKGKGSSEVFIPIEEGKKEYFIEAEC